MFQLRTSACFLLSSMELFHIQRNPWKLQLSSTNARCCVKKGKEWDPTYIQTHFSEHQVFVTSCVSADSRRPSGLTGLWLQQSVPLSVIWSQNHPPPPSPHTHTHQLQHSERLNTLHGDRTPSMKDNPVLMFICWSSDGPKDGSARIQLKWFCSAPSAEDVTETNGTSSAGK